MAKSDAAEKALSALAALRGKPATPDARQQISTALKSKVNLIAASAAKLAAELRLADLEAELIAAFDRFMISPTSTDKLCAGKLAIAEALFDFDSRALDLFVAGARHVQYEPAWGGNSDTAVELRGRCAMALVNLKYRDVMTILVDHLGDPSPQARISAARTLAATGRDDAALLLRLKILADDKEAEVIAECLTGLMSIDAKKSLDFAARFLDHPNEMISQSAALAMGQSRLPEALAILRKHADHLNIANATELFLAIAMTRLPEAIDYLLDRAAQSAADTKEIIPALVMYRHDETIAKRLGAIVNLHKSPALLDEFRKTFPNQ